MIQISASEPRTIIQYIQKHTQTRICNLTEMPYGDYCWLINTESEALERKYITDFVSSMFSGRLTKQLRGCIDEFKRVFLLVEGIWDCEDNKLVVYRKSRKGVFVPAFYSPNLKYDDVWSAIKTVLAYVDVVFTPNMEATARVILNLSNGLKEKNLMTKAVKKKRIPIWTREIKVVKLMNLVDRLPESIAKDLIKEFGSIQGVLDASDDTLIKVEKMGKGLVKNLRDAIS